MKNNSGLTILILGIIVAAGIIIAWQLNKKSQENNDRLPVYNPAEINDSLVDPSLQNKGTGHRISDFSLIDQNGRTITQADLEGKIYVADFFFIRCGSICPKMTSQLQRVQKKYKDENQVMILSHTVLPEMDTVEAMKQYAVLYDADDSMWLFLTGDKKQIYELARKSYFVVKEAAPGAGDEDSDFIHTENFVLVDKEKRIRGYYDGTSEEDVNRLMSDMDKLLREYQM